MSSEIEVKQDTQIVTQVADTQTDEMYDKFKTFLNKRHMAPEAIISNMNLGLATELELDILIEIFSKA